MQRRFGQEIKINYPFEKDSVKNPTVLQAVGFLLPNIFS